MSKFVPGELFPTDRNERQAALGGIVLADTPSDGLIDDLQAEPAASYVRYCQGEAHLFHEIHAQGK